MQKLQLYKELESNGRCEATRRLRSLVRKQSVMLSQSSTFELTELIPSSNNITRSKTLIGQNILALSLFCNAVVVFVVFFVGTVLIARKILDF